MRQFSLETLYEFIRKNQRKEVISLISDLETLVRDYYEKGRSVQSYNLWEGIVSGMFKSFTALKQHLEHYHATR